VADEQILTSSRDATLGDPIFWRNDSPEVEPETEQTTDSAAELDMPAQKQEETMSPQLAEPLELIREEQDDTLTSVVDSEHIVLDPAAQAPLNVDADKPPELATNPLDWLATAPAERSDAASEMTPALDEPVADAAATIDTAEISKHSEPVAEPNTSSSDQTMAQVAPPSTQTPEDTARSIPKQDWADLTAVLRARTSEHETQQILAAAQLSAQVPAPTQGLSEAEAANPSQSPAPPDPALVEAVVERVLDKMRPQVVEIITREFLRPVVQALVHREIEKL
jgi:hypothetical protein